MTLELRPVWCAASEDSRPTSATDVWPASSRAVTTARPTIPPPTTTTSWRGLGAGTDPAAPTLVARAPARGASATVLLSTGSHQPGLAGLGGAPTLPVVGVVARHRGRVGVPHQQRHDPHPPAGVLAALGAQPQAPDLGLRARQRDPAETLGEEPADGVDVLAVELDAGGLLEVLDRQARGGPQRP